MYTNELLKEKYKAQRDLLKKAKTLSMDYLKIVEMEVKELFKNKGWKQNFSKRKGEWKIPRAILKND